MSYLHGPQTYGVGSRGSDVMRIQVTLNALGYNVGTADGIYGPKTKDGVARYQSDNGLMIDGIVGPQTWALLMGGEGPSAPPTPVPVPVVTPPTKVLTTMRTPAVPSTMPFAFVGAGNMPIILGGLGLLVIGSVAMAPKRRWKR